MKWFRTPGRAVLTAGARDWVYEREPFAPPAPVPLTRLIECIETGRPPLGTIRNAREAFVLAMAAYESARERRRVGIRARRE